jgi:hypothetical protein
MEEEVPLLKGDYHQGCPGCAYDRKKEVYRGLPYKEFLYLWMICLTAGMYGTFPPFLQPVTFRVCLDPWLKIF